MGHETYGMNKRIYLAAARTLFVSYWRFVVVVVVVVVLLEICCCCCRYIDMYKLLKCCWKQNKIS